jgi:ribose transport system permease protein
VSVDQSVKPDESRQPLISLRDLRFQFAPRYRVVWISLAGLVILCLASAPSVFHTDSMTLVTALAGVLAIAAAGQLLVVIAGGIDLSVPAVITLAAGIIVHQTNAHNSSLAGAVVLALVVSGAIGLTNGLLVAVGKLNAVIVTLAMAGTIAGVTLLWLGTSFSDSGNVPPNLASFANKHVGFLSVVGIIALVLIAVLALTMRSTRPGRSYVAAGTNRVAAEIIGIRVIAYEVFGYTFAGVLYGVAGIFLAGLLTSPDQTVGSAYQLTTIIAVALGGASLAGGPASLMCTLAGCFFLSLLSQYLQTKSFSAGVSGVVNGVVLIVAVALVTAGSGGRMQRIASWPARMLKRGSAGEQAETG